MKADPTENRKSYRFLAGVRAFVIFGAARVPCQAIDLNRQGVLVEGDFDVEGLPQAMVQVESTSGDLRFETAGKVAHRTENEATGKTRLGIQFDAISKEQEETLELLLSRLIEGMDPAPLTQLERGATETEILDALGKIPLAHKITFAQRAQPLQRSFLMHDNSPQVIEAICRNPQLTRPEVVEVLRMPKLLSTTLELLSRDSRWTSSEEIKITIVTHPRVTFPIADRLVKTLSLVGIRKVIRKPGLNPAIKIRLVQTIPHKQLKGW